MMKNEKGFELKISAVDFVISPVTICVRGGTAKQYSIELDKGAQILRRFEERIELGPHETYHFASGERATFRLQNERAACEWGLYSANADMSEFVDALPLTLTPHFTAFADSIRSQQTEYMRVAAEHALGREVSRLWELLRERCQCDFPSLTATNRTATIELVYNLEIRCEADSWAQAEKTKSTRSLKTIRSNAQLNGLRREAHEDDDLLPKATHQPEPADSQAHAEEAKVPTETPRETPVKGGLARLESEMSKKGSALSDIIECSVESSNLNDREKRNELKEIAGIPEEDNELCSPQLSILSNARTQNFEAAAVQENALKRRSNTFAETNRDEELGKEELRDIETQPQSKLTEPDPQPTQAKRGGRAKYVVAFLFCLLLIASLAFYSHTHPEEPPKPHKKPAKAKKPERPRKA